MATRIGCGRQPVWKQPGHIPDQGVIAGAAVDQVAGRPAPNHVGASPAEQPVPAETPDHEVAAAAGSGPVVAPAKIR